MSSPEADSNPLRREIAETSNQAEISPYVWDLVMNTPEVYKKMVELLKVEEGLIPRGKFESQYKHSFDVAHLSEIVFDEYYSVSEEVKSLAPEEQAGRKKIFLLSAILHDIGKTSVSPETLTGRGPLTDEKRKEIRAHPQRSKDICLEISRAMDTESDRQVMAEVISEIVMRHHFYSEGYPFEAELKKDPDPETEAMITEISRMISVIDSFDALSSPRSYEEPHEPAETRKILLEKFKNYPSLENLINFLADKISN
ncbi:MAG: hypothetical protein A2744_04265 [Candidatus Buchananbacteria bacterium RIFCSPHIGHO2_01_FULL_44_11]|uniref:HD-GYP domain-containing protein n=1 Tax=Candidatus Buchananbacteria bacterium RIFCSPHIGHO2_01_FULL_44_11 TaxID=1797535 RepID=A0A1G1Y0Q9_9BACT|nr:MAG: hypothetical protein A2744_04265 [Candidatus Buchananbacteria bacterium RIFCSPHIGHO2_01_FULL_44_11]